MDVGAIEWWGDASSVVFLVAIPLLWTGGWGLVIISLINQLSARRAGEIVTLSPKGASIVLKLGGVLFAVAFILSLIFAFLW